MSEPAQTKAASPEKDEKDSREPRADSQTGDDERDPEEVSGVPVNHISRAILILFPLQAQLLAELERQERELREMQAMHDTISGAQPAAPTGEATAASGSAAMDTAQDGEAGEGNAEQEEVDGRSVYVGNVSTFFAFSHVVGLRPLCLLMCPRCRLITERRPRSCKSISRVAARSTG